jgi:F420-non-reducing hydrogenase iron-sulfur subunit
LARAEGAKLVLEDLGIDPRRFAIEWVSSAEAMRFSEVVTAFTNTIKELGPNPLKSRGKEVAQAA